LNEIKIKAKLSDEEVQVCIGILKKKAAVNIEKDNGLLFQININGEKLLKNGLLEEEFLKRANKGLEADELKDELKYGFDSLAGRKNIVKIEGVREKNFFLTEKGKQIAVMDLSKESAERLTHEMLAGGKWRGKEFRAYDVSINVPSINRGKRHIVDQSINYAKKIWLEMGFTEMKGNIAQSSFWDLDALFVPQDHPAREMQDTFYVGDKKIDKIELPAIFERVKKIHEEKWGGKWDNEKAKEVLLRTHTTVLSAQTIAKLKKENLPAKFFAIGRVYRNEALDWKHLFEFYQVEGIVVDPNANFRNLIGYLKEFYSKMGFEKIRLRPAHFPYTEPSVEVEVFHPERKEWIELGGAGIFRPEVVKPLLGFECPVLAWGQGLERGIMDYYGLKDLRDLYKNDLKMLGSMKEWIKCQR